MNKTIQKTKYSIIIKYVLKTYLIQMDSMQKCRVRKDRTFCFTPHFKSGGVLQTSTLTRSSTSSPVSFPVLQQTNCFSLLPFLLPPPPINHTNHHLQTSSITAPNSNSYSPGSLQTTPPKEAFDITANLQLPFLLSKHYFLVLPQALQQISCCSLHHLLFFNFLFKLERLHFYHYLQWITQIFLSKLPSYHSLLYSCPQIQQTFLGNPPANPAGEQVAP